MSNRLNYKQAKNMYAIEFEADVHNNTIQIPIQYKELEAKHIKIFVLETNNKQKKLPSGFLNPIVISSYKNTAKRVDLYDR